MTDARGTTLISLLVGLAIAAMATALAGRCLALTAATITAGQRASSDLVARSRAADLLCAVLSWSGCGEAGAPSSLVVRDDFVSATLRPSIDGARTTFVVTRRGDQVTLRREGGRQWTVVEGCPREGRFLVEEGLVTIPLGGGFSAVVAPGPRIGRPVPWRPR